MPFFHVFPDKAGLQSAADIVQSHVTRGATPTYGVDPSLVEYGIARFRHTHQGRIAEPLAFLSLMQWLETLDNLHIRAGIRSRLSSRFSRGNAYEEVIFLYLHHMLQYGLPLSTIFKFHGTPPSWANEVAEIVARRDGVDVPVGILGGISNNPGLSVVYYARTIKDIIWWLEHPATAPPVLVSTILFGPDVLIRIKGIILMGQLKFYTVGNKESLNAKTITEALTSLTPSHWFKKSVCPVLLSVC
jgi:hypothetical protein